MSVYEQWGMRCPSCGSDAHLTITATVTVRLVDDGTEEENGGHEWDDGSHVFCNDCSWDGTVLDTQPVTLKELIPQMTDSQKDRMKIHAQS